MADHVETAQSVAVPPSNTLAPALHVGAAIALVAALLHAVMVGRPISAASEA